MDSQLDLLEKRSEALNGRIFKNNSIDDFDKSKPILHVLCEVQDLLSSALAGQSKIKSSLKSLDELNTVLDPNYENSFVDSEVKSALILNNYEGILDCLASLEEFNKQKNTVLNEDLSKVISNQPNLSNVIDRQIVIKSAVENQTKQINNLILKYNSFMENLNNYVLFIDKKLTDLEISKNAKPSE